MIPVDFVGTGLNVGGCCITGSLIPNVFDDVLFTNGGLDKV